MAVYANRARYLIKLKTSPNWDEMASFRDEIKIQLTSIPLI